MTGGTIDAQALAASLRRLQEQDDRGSLRGSLEQVVNACVDLFAVTGSGLMLCDENGELRYVVASDGPGRLLEQAQIDTGQGPCVDTYVGDGVTACADLATDDRYPELAPRVVPHGVDAVLGVPVRLSGLVIGSLDAYRDVPHQWDGSEQRALVRFGAVVDTLLATAVTADRAGELAAHLRYALDYRVPIERGIGYLMARDHLDHATAFTRLRAAARASRHKIGDVAAELLRTGQLPRQSR